MLNKYNTNLEDSFLIYKAQRFIQDNNEEVSKKTNKSSQGNDLGFVNAITSKPILKNVQKSCQ